MTSSTLYTGPMKSGKSEALIERIRELSQRGESFLCVKPALDNRNGDFLWSRRYKESEQYPAVRVHSAKQVIEIVTRRNFKAVFIDEIMFFDSGIFGLIDYLLFEGIDLYAAGLDTDFRKLPFPLADYHQTGLTMQDVCEQFEEVIRLHSTCDVCGDREATLTQRLINGAPASPDEDVICVGDEEYQARCRKCHSF